MIDLDSIIKFQVLITLWKHECKRVIADRFTMPKDVEWFDQALVKLADEELGKDLSDLVDYGEDVYFVDFLRNAPEVTGTAQPTILEACFHTLNFYR